MQVYDWQSGKQTADCQVGGDFFYERVRFQHTGQWLLGVGGAGKDPKLVLFDLEKQTLLAEAKLPSPAFDIVLTETSDVCYTVGRGKVCKWAITN